MSSSTSNISLARSRSLRIPPPNFVKPATTAVAATTTAAQTPSGPSNITLFLTNLRLLDLDLRPDWPDISILTFSTKDAQQNQKKRLQCVEWALFQLFALWDPEETRNKLQPYFPPLEPLQSLNLRAALFRCLDQAKKNGVLGRDTVLRKTMLDECKGDRLDEVLAVFSNAVVKKALQAEWSGYEALAQQLAVENFSYSGERTILSALILAHKASLSKHLKGKEDARARYHDFSDLLNLNDRRIARRHEQLKQAMEENRENGSMAQREVYAVQDTVGKNWAGNTEWLETILYGDSRSNTDGFLATPFDKIWQHVDNGSIGEVEGTNRVGLLEQLDARVKDQERRLAKWQDFGKTLSKPAGSSPVKDAVKDSAEPNKIDLNFNLHQNLQIGRSTKDKVLQSNSVSLEEYTRLVENMRTELADVSRPQVWANRPPRQSLLVEKRRSLVAQSPVPSLQELPEGKDEDWSSAGDMEGESSESPNYATKSTSRTPPSETPADITESVEVPVQIKPVRPPVPKFKETIKVNIAPKPATTPSPKDPSPPRVRPITPPLPSPPIRKPAETESDLADQILNSVSAASPSPKKQRHTLSLAERTRLSMSRTSHSQYSDLHDEFEITDLPRLSIKPARPSLAPRAPSTESDPHADLIERTRKSMAGFEAAQKKAQIERRRSVKDAKKKQRESSYFPKVEEETVATPEVGGASVELMEGDPDYESVFMSRPKIATSPAVSPSRIWEEDEGELELVV
ncbi:HAUS augmin-like complex subunit 6 N-terminus-domain-containing protein [Rhexocercosporidium sp. MPI-PUGE-AT-0058]|nr:HAUS augmin-like complex subunit 6 N-terminus-domain-containing protein [Rhexocercosporidium sp. MPI-PUGE-AT-0058]